MSSGGDGRATASASKSRQPKRKKNAPGSRRDPGWEYATDIDGDSKKTKCKFCSKVLSGGIFHFKHHLARTKENVEPCLSVHRLMLQESLSTILCSSLLRDMVLVLNHLRIMRLERHLPEKMEKLRMRMPRN
ncbi:hypothetical protein LINPERPRIM_LOCUS41629 [Linum perenne]